MCNARFYNQKNKTKLAVSFISVFQNLTFVKFYWKTTDVKLPHFFIEQDRSTGMGTNRRNLLI